MGNKKNLILAAIVIVLFVASGLVLYNGLFKGRGSVVTDAVPDIDGAQKEIVNLLPHGTSLDFAQVKARGASSTPFTYAPVDQNTVGVDIHSLINSGPDGSDTAVTAAPQNRN